MAWTAPRTWIPGEWLSSDVWNRHIADNIQDIFDRYTNIRGVYKDIETTTLANVRLPNPPIWVEVGSLSIDTRHEAVLLTVVAQSTAGFVMAYRVDAGADRVIFYQGGTPFVAWQVIIPSLDVGVHSIKVDMQREGTRASTINSLQIDVRELT